MGADTDVHMRKPCTTILIKATVNSQSIRNRFHQKNFRFFIPELSTINCWVRRPHTHKRTLEVNVYYLHSVVNCYIQMGSNCFGHGADITRHVDLSSLASHLWRKNTDTNHIESLSSSLRSMGPRCTVNSAGECQNMND